VEEEADTCSCTHECVYAFYIYRHASKACYFQLQHCYTMSTTTTTQMAQLLATQHYPTTLRFQIYRVYLHRRTHHSEYHLACSTHTTRGRGNTMRGSILSWVILCMYIRGNTMCYVCQYVCIHIYIYIHTHTYIYILHINIHTYV